ncbi:CRISPR-associated helicase Cas3' [Plantactinospora endophytica]|uniref:CRISPR-associated helicase Cas3' n=1 Tax=Plantactinospora endophytica TaxID=673535 RepID=UPI00366D8792
MNKIGLRHRLEDHLRGTAELARRFAAPFLFSELAWWTGLVHDGGKAWCAWQDKLLLVEPTNGRVGLDHKSFGVQLARQFGLRPVEWAVAGHHGGLTCEDEVDDLFGRSDADEARLRSGPWADVERRLRLAVPEIFERPPMLPADFAPGADRLRQEFLVRFLFSCLVDADVLDTQAHRESVEPRIGRDLDAPGLLKRFLERRAKYLRKRMPGALDGWREEVFAAALRVAEQEPGIFRLTAPTGTAKTIAAAGFALKHAAKYGKRRVIVAVPFITITEQNAVVYQRLLDPEDMAAERVVLEHHSQVEMGDEDQSNSHHSWRRLAAENWDAPFVVTTTVQLFESLFGRTQSQARKLHRIANSVLVLDEVQAMPHRLLSQIADALRILSERFGVTVLLSSATQPELRELNPLRDLRSTEIVSNPKAMFDACRRVRYEWRHSRRLTLADVAAEALAHPQALLVVNTVRDARNMFLALRRLAGDGVTILHLSTAMCPAHRRKVLDTVRRLLEAGDRVLLASTSLVEAGVDLDFPVAFRAISPPESMAQVAGRCNREGNLGDQGGLVVIFDPADGGQPRSYKTQIEVAQEYFGPGKAKPEDITALRKYFPELYRTLGIEDLGSVAKTIEKNRSRWDFRAVADGPVTQAGTTKRNRELAFRMIIDDTVPAVVPYPDPIAMQTIKQCLDRLRSPQADMKAIRLLQPYIITLRRDTAQERAVFHQLDPVVGDLLEWRGDYDDGYGVVLEPRTDDFIL